MEAREHERRAAEVRDAERRELLLLNVQRREASARQLAIQASIYIYIYIYIHTYIGLTRDILAFFELRLIVYIYT